MRALFPGYFNREPKEIAAIWKECIFSFDANFLLDFYRSTPKLQKTLFRILGIVNDRSWLTYQAALEYYRNRETVIRESSDSYDKVSGLVKDAAKNIENGLKQYQKHTAIEVEKIMEIVKKATAEAETLLQELKGKHPDHTKKDEIEEKLSNLFAGKVGAPYSQDVLQAVFQKAAQRFADRIPPGYKDEQEKDGHRRFGDVVLWFSAARFCERKEKARHINHGGFKGGLVD
jgi:PIN like domain